MGIKEFSRTERVAEQIRRELADILARESSDPRLERLTISEVEVSKDLAHARVYITPRFGADVKEVLRALKRARGYLRRTLARRLRLRGMPELRFLHDASVDDAARLSELIDAAVAADRAHHTPGDEER